MFKKNQTGKAKIFLLFLLLAHVACKQAATDKNPDEKKKEFTYVNPSAVYPTLQFAFSQGVTAPSGGQTLYLAGLTAWDSAMQVVGKDDFKVQLRQCFKNIKAVVSGAGGKMTDVVRLTYFVKDMDINKAMAVVEVVKEFFPENKYPAGSLIGVEKLVEDAFWVEIEATAVINR